MGNKEMFSSFISTTDLTDIQDDEVTSVYTHHVDLHRSGSTYNGSSRSSKNLETVSKLEKRL